MPTTFKVEHPLGARPLHTLSCAVHTHPRCAPSRDADASLCSLAAWPPLQTSGVPRALVSGVHPTGREGGSPRCCRLRPPSRRKQYATLTRLPRARREKYTDRVPVIVERSERRCVWRLCAAGQPRWGALSSLTFSPALSLAPPPPTAAATCRTLTRRVRAHPQAQSHAVTDVSTEFLVPSDLTCGQFVYVIRKRIKLSPEKALFIFCNNQLPPTSALMSSVYAEHKDQDGFLYITYAGENSFG
jgi:hypothetical protein